MPMASHARWRLADTAGGPSTEGGGACAAAGRRGGALGTVRVLMVTSLRESGLRGTRFRRPQPMSRGAPFHPRQAEAPMRDVPRPGRFDAALRPLADAVRDDRRDRLGVSADGQPAR